MTTVLKDNVAGGVLAPIARRKRSPLGSKWTPYLFMAPAALYLLFFQGYPLLRELWLSFTKTSLLSPTKNVWVGIDNFTKIFSSLEFQHTLLTTLLYVVIVVVGTLAVGLGVALLMNGKFRGRGIARALIVSNPELRGPLKSAGFLTRDARVKERKKPGLKKARKAPQYTKR